VVRGVAALPVGIHGVFWAGFLRPKGLLLLLLWLLLQLFIFQTLGLQDFGYRPAVRSPKGQPARKRKAVNKIELFTLHLRCRLKTSVHNASCPLKYDGHPGRMEILVKYSNVTCAILPVRRQKGVLISSSISKLTTA